MYVCMYVCMRMYILIITYICMYLRTDVCMYVCMYAIIFRDYAINIYVHICDQSLENSSKSHIFI